MRTGPAHLAIGAAMLVAGSARVAAAEEPALDPSAAVKPFEGPPGRYVRFLFSAASGVGFRFNNPYRLSTELGDDAASTSLTAPFLDFAASALGGPPSGVQHGGSLHVGSSLAGPGQPYLTPSYILAYRASLPVLVYGRIGTPIVLAPDPNIGGEIAASVSYFFTAGIGVTTEVAFDLFYGAATLDEQYTAIPVLFAQLGVVADYELLP